ncbi:MAG: hypothetical protein JEY99_21310 [Spirochaetales bacterium]|nr:hypothetical protein [Spirochaetales bacterium]
MGIENLLTEKIGQGLVRAGEISQDDVDFVLRKQKDGDSRLFGEIAVDMGIVDLMAVIRFIERQDESEE